MFERRGVKIPNHVRNVLTFKHLTKLDQKAILNRITRELEDDIYPLNKIIDFDKIIPEPRTESECPDDCKVNKDSHVEEDKERPWFDWYKWRNKYWNTKWGAYDCYTKIGTTTVTFVFSTAWSPAIPIFEKLTEMFNYDFEIKWADEDLGSNCAKWEWSTSVHNWYMQEERDFKDPYRFAKRIWDTY